MGREREGRRGEGEGERGGGKRGREEGERGGEGGKGLGEKVSEGRQKGGDFNKAHYYVPI